MAGDEEPLDTSIAIVTPENIAFRYRAAGPFRRLPAYVIDLVIRVLAIIVLSIVFSLGSAIVGFGGWGIGAALILWFLLDWFYGGLFEALWNGQTPGKRIMRIRVLSDEGQPINGWQAILRNFLRAADMMPLVTYQLALWTTAMNDRFQRLGDLACGTMVVVDESSRHYGIRAMQDAEALELSARLPRSFRPDRSLSRALSTYVERRPRFSRRRRVEVARHLAEPLRTKFGLPPDTHPDLLLCALYHRTFIGTDGDVDARAALFELPTAVVPDVIEIVP